MSKKNRFTAFMKVWGKYEDNLDTINQVHDRIKYQEVFDKIPYPCVLDWYSTDNPEAWEKNQRVAPELLKQYNWTEDSIKYDLNTYGFRNREFVPNPNSIITIGECFTFGTGLPREMTWPDMLEKETKFEIFNLSRPLSGLDHSFRHLLYWLPVLKSKKVLMLENSGDVREIFEANQSQPIGNWSNEEWKRVLTANKNERYISRKKNLLAIQKWCEMHDVEFHVVECNRRNEIGKEQYEKHKEEPYAVARDLMHPGFHFQRAMKDVFKEILEAY